MLYAPWCGHCKTLRPEFAKLATNVLGEIKVAKIDASTNRQFDKTYGLKGYPHIVFIPAGKNIYMKDQRIKKSTTSMKELEQQTASPIGRGKR